MDAGVTVKTKDRSAEIIANIRELAKTQLLVGIPQEKDPRKDGGEAGNSLIGYIAENGSPAKNIPARPWLVPGVKNGLPKAMAVLKKTAADAVTGTGGAGAVTAGFQAAGIILRNAVVERISSNIPPPLAPSTVRSRRVGYSRRRKMAKKRGVTIGTIAREEIALGEHGAAGGVIALVASGQFRRAVTFVLRKR